MDDQASGVLDVLGQFLAGLVKALAWVERTYPGPVWVVLLILSIVGGVHHAVTYMRTRRVSVAGTVVGTLGHTDPSGATMWRGAARVERTPSLSPFHGRPVILRALPGPVAVIVAWMMLHAPLPLYLAVAAVALWQGYRAYWRLRTRRHRREIVEPMAAALSSVYGRPAREIMSSGLIIPPNWGETGVILTIPLPDGFREHHVIEALAIVSERLGGQWDHRVAQRAPFSIGMRRRPPEDRGVVEVIRPMAAALGRAQGVGADDILDGLQMRISRELPAGQEYDPDALVVVPLPDHYRPGDVEEAARIVQERLGGVWVRRVTPTAPFRLVMQHRPPDPEYVVEVVRPMTEALEPVLGIDSDRILEGVIVPPDWEDEHAQVIVPLPGGFRPSQVTEVVRVVEERLGGDWSGRATKVAPFSVHLKHKPQPPELVTLPDVADFILRYAQQRTFFLGIGAGDEHRTFAPHRDAPHIALSAGTQAGKSTQNRNLILGAAAMGALQICIDPKIHSFDGCEVIPGVSIYNNPLRLDLMWAAIHVAAQETRRRMMLPRGTEDFQPLYVHMEEQNQFATEMQDWWLDIREFDDEIDDLCAANPILRSILGRYRSDKLPKAWPGWRDIQMMLNQGGAFDVHLVSTYQRMDAEAVGGSSSKGGQLRAQYGVKLLSHFEPSGWINVVGTRPIPKSPQRKGRWISAQGSTRKEYQGPRTEVEDIEWFLDYSGIGMKGVSPAVSSARPNLPLPEAVGLSGDKGTPLGGELPVGEASTSNGSPGGTLLPFPGRAEREDRESITLSRTPEPRRYLIREAVEQGLIPANEEWWKKERQRAQKRGDAFPEGVKYGNGRKYSAEELNEYYKARKGDDTGT